MSETISMPSDATGEPFIESSTLQSTHVIKGDVSEQDKGGVDLTTYTREDEWGITSLFSRWILCRRGTFGVANTVSLGVAIVRELIDNEFYSPYLRSFSAFSYDSVDIRVEFSSPSFVGGHFILRTFYDTKLDTAPNQLLEVATTMSGPSACLSKNTVMEIQHPWSHFNPYVDLQEEVKPTLGYYLLQQIHPLRGIATGRLMDYTISMKFNNFRVLHPLLQQVDLPMSVPDLAYGNVNSLLDSWRRDQFLTDISLQGGSEVSNISKTVYYPSPSEFAHSAAPGNVPSRELTIVSPHEDIFKSGKDDEMLVSNFIKHPVLMQTITGLDLATAGNVVGVQQLDISIWRNSPIRLMADYTTFWTGDFCMKFSSNIMLFESMVMAVVLMPLNEDVEVGQPFQNYTAYPHQLIHFRDGTDPDPFTINMSATPKYRTCFSAAPFTTPLGDDFSYQSLSTVPYKVVFILDKRYAAGISVPQNLNVGVWMWSENLEFFGRSSRVPRNYVYQGGIGIPTTPQNNIMAGVEPIVHLQQLSHPAYRQRFNIVNSTLTPGTSTVADKPRSIAPIPVTPYWIESNGVHPRTRICDMFAFWTGSIDYYIKTDIDGLTVQVSTDRRTLLASLESIDDNFLNPTYKLGNSSGQYVAMTITPISSRKFDTHATWTQCLRVLSYDAATKKNMTQLDVISALGADFRFAGYNGMAPSSTLKSQITSYYNSRKVNGDVRNIVSFPWATTNTLEQKQSVIERFMAAFTSTPPTTQTSRSKRVGRSITASTEQSTKSIETTTDDVYKIYRENSMYMLFWANRAFPTPNAAFSDDDLVNKDMIVNSDEAVAFMMDRIGIRGPRIYGSGAGTQTFEGTVYYAWRVNRTEDSPLIWVDRSRYGQFTRN